MSFDVDGVTQNLADALEGSGFTVCVQPERSEGHVGWLGKHVSNGPIEGVRWIAVQERAGDRAVLGQIRVEVEGHGFHDLGLGVDHPRVGSMRWRVAEGYVNGYPLLDILWFALTRFRRRRR